MWLVDIALRRPLTYIVMALMILLATPFVLRSTPTDILPEIRIPVISIVWAYNGLPATEIGNRITGVTERALTTTVNDIEHIESQSMAGVAVVKLFFQPNANIQTALAQVVAISQTQLRMLPPGTTPPLVILYSASSVPVVQVGLSSATLSEQQLNDIGMTQVRTQLITVPGAAVPFPYGGKTRVVSVDLDTQALLAKGLTATDVVSAISAQNLILPAGTAKLGELEHAVRMNGSPDTIDAMNQLPVRSVNGAITYLREVAHVRDGFQPQVNIVKQNGERGVLLSVMKLGGASTLQVVDDVRAKIAEMRKGLPEALDLTLLFDQSIFVKAAISSVLHEAVIASLLTAALILLFLGSWRSTCIIAVSIPLSILSSILALNALGETINLMTLGGLTLAIGILVDDATVTIENIERHLHLGKDLYTAIYDGASEIALPALVSTLCICIVFLPMFFLTGVARYLFVPLAEAVVFAMLASYFLSRTLVPTMALLMMKQSARQGGATKPGRFAAIHHRFDSAFERMRGAYVAALSALLVRRKAFIGSFLGFCIASCGLFLILGEDFFPTVDAGQLRLHMRMPSGTRIEETARAADLTEKAIRDLIPAEELGTVLANIGVPSSGINLSYSNSGTFGVVDAEFLIALKPGHQPSQRYADLLRAELPKRLPGNEFYFQPADILSQILNFGAPSAIDIQFAGKDMNKSFALAQQVLKRVQAIPGTVDVHIHQRLDQPTLAMEMDRTALQQLNLSAANVAQNVLVSLSGSFQTAPAFWMNPQTGIVYNVLVQTPQHKIDTLDALLRTPVSGSTPGNQPQLLGNLVKVSPATQPAVVSHHDIANVIDIYVGVQGRDVGSVVKEIRKIVADTEPQVQKGGKLTLRGQVQTMQSSYAGLLIGLAGAIVLVYLLIVVNFQSWLDPLIIISALPAALAGIAWMLFLSGTHLSVPALTGAIMTMGVATANSILMVSFARQRLAAGVPPLSAALEAGATRIRPVLMTALAMIIGMVPMALALGEGAEQNAPLGRAVIGGLLFATISTLFFVPVVFAAAHRYLARRARGKGAMNTTTLA
jgi:CzcA family heavy metal efflux pump